MKTRHTHLKYRRLLAEEQQICFDLGESQQEALTARELGCSSGAGHPLV